MSHLSPEAAELLARAMQLSEYERGLLIDQLMESLEAGRAEPGAEQAWAQVIKRRLDEVRSGKVNMLQGEDVLRELAEEFPDEK